MVSIKRVERIIIFLVALNLYGLVMARDDLKDDPIDRGSRSDRGGLWFGPRLGKRSLRLVNDDNRQTFLRLLEAADALKYYYDELSYESRADDPETKVTKKVIFTPKLGRSLESYESVDFTPRLGRRLADDRVTPADQDNYRPEVEQMDRTKYFSPRLGRTMNFSPRLGRELSYGYIALIVSISSGHVLFAANVEDFRNLAKQWVPENVADKLIDMVSHNRPKYNDNNNNEYEYDDAVGENDDEYSDEEYEDNKNQKEPWRGEEYLRKPDMRQGHAPDPEVEAMYAKHDTRPGNAQEPEAEAMYSKHDTRQGNAREPENEEKYAKPTDIKQSDNSKIQEPMQVNLDDLVEKVRERLLYDFHKNPSELQKLLGANTNVTAHFEGEKNQTGNIEKHYLREGYDEKQNQQNGPAGEIIAKPQSSIQKMKEWKYAKLQANEQDDLPEVDVEGNVRIPKDQRHKTDPSYIFQEVNLTNNKNDKDSYEDYVTPKREDEVFSSKKSTTTTKQHVSQARWSRPTKPTQGQDIFNYNQQNNILVSQVLQQTNQRESVSSTNPSIFDDSNETTTEPNLKARTENLWFDYKDEPIKKVMQMNAQDPSKIETRKVKLGTLGTMIPTRQTYKMSSPNYYGQLPTIAEKYNFDEPIPEKDREKEDLKPFGNPPAIINGKIKVK